MGMFGLHPLVEVLQGVVDLLDVELHVHEVGVDLVAPQVVCQGRVHRLTVLRDHGSDGLELRDTPGDRPGAAGEEVGALTVDEVGVVEVRPSGPPTPWAAVVACPIQCIPIARQSPVDPACMPRSTRVCDRPKRIDRYVVTARVGSYRNHVRCRLRRRRSAGRRARSRLPASACRRALPSSRGSRWPRTQAAPGRSAAQRLRLLDEAGVELGPGPGPMRPRWSAGGVELDAEDGRRVAARVREGRVALERRRSRGHARRAGGSGGRCEPRARGEAGEPVGEGVDARRRQVALDAARTASSDGSASVSMPAATARR